MARPGSHPSNPGWFRPGPDPRRHQLSAADRSKGGVQSYGLLLMERPGTAWWVLNARIIPTARAKRQADLLAWLEGRQSEAHTLQF